MESAHQQSSHKSKAERILIVTIYSFFWVPFCFDVFLITLDVMETWLTNKIPDEIQAYYTAESFVSSKSISYLENAFSLSMSLFWCLLVTVTIRDKIIWRIWKSTSSVAKKFPRIKEELFTSTITFSILVVVQNIPSLISDALNPIVDKVDFVFEVITLLAIVLVFPCLLYYGARLGGKKFFVIFFITVAALLFAVAVLYNELKSATIVNEEIRNQTDLRDGIENLSARTSVPADKIYFTREDYLNAYTAGYFNTKRIVIFDKFLQCVQCNQTKCKHELVPCPAYNGTDAMVINGTDGAVNGTIFKKYFTTNEILAVIAHEIGHWKGNHTTITLVVILALDLTIWLSCSFLYGQKYLYDAFHFHNIQPVVMGFYFIYTFIFWPISDRILGYPLNFLWRYFEYDSDDYSKNLGYGKNLISGLSKAQSVLGRFPISNKLFSLFKLEHPTLMERIKKLNE